MSDEPERLVGPASPGLARLQGWMQSVVTHPDGAEQGVLSAGARERFEPGDLPLLVKTRGALTPLERLSIYQGMHLPRMLDALASDYPMLRGRVGEKAFEEIVGSYVQSFPSRGYTLNRLGDRLPAFLETRGASRGRRSRVDLARLELAITEVFDAEETPAAGPEKIAAIPAEDWPRMRFRPIAPLRLVALETNAHAVFEALRGREPVPPVRRKRERVLVFRRNYGVRRRALPSAAFVLLQELITGNTLGAALEKLTKSFRSLEPASLTAWTREWILDGLFQEIAHV